MKSGWDPTGTSEDDGPRHGQGISQQRNICDPSARPELCRQRGGVAKFSAENICDILSRSGDVKMNDICSCSSMDRTADF